MACQRYAMHAMASTAGLTSLRHAFQAPMQPHMPSRIGPRHSRGRPLCALSPDVVFGAATLVAMPAYALLLAAPRGRLSQQVASSPWLYLAAAAAYSAALLQWRLLPALWAALRAAALTGGWPDAAAFGRLFAAPAATALTWVHLLTLDLFQAR